MRKQRTNLMPKLKKLAEESNCNVEDNRIGTSIEVTTKDGWSWENGERASQITAYGDGGSYLPEWRQEAIQEAIERLAYEQPEPVPYLYDED